MAYPDVRLKLEFVEHPHGRCQAILTDEDGNILLDHTYKNLPSAKAGVNYRLKREGLTGAILTEVDPGETEAHGVQQPDAQIPSLADEWLLKLRTEAQKALDEALRLRERADVLEVEHKRLTAAADVLEGPEADG